MGRPVPDSDGSLAAAFGVTLAVVTLVVAPLAPAVALSAAGCLAAGYLLAGVQSRSRGRTAATETSFSNPVDRNVFQITYLGVALLRLRV